MDTASDTAPCFLEAKTTDNFWKLLLWKNWACIFSQPWVLTSEALRALQGNTRGQAHATQLTFYPSISHRKLLLPLTYRCELEGSSFDCSPAIYSLGDFRQTLHASVSSSINEDEEVISQVHPPWLPFGMDLQQCWDLDLQSFPIFLICLHTNPLSTEINLAWWTDPWDVSSWASLPSIQCL